MTGYFSATPDYKNSVTVSDLITGDIRCTSPAILDNIGAIINLSRIFEHDPTAEYNPEANHQMNAVATRTLAEMAKQKGVRRYIFASSCSVYDVGVVDEERDIVLNEDVLVQPRAAYAVSKLAGERSGYLLWPTTISGR